MHSVLNWSWLNRVIYRVCHIRKMVRVEVISMHRCPPSLQERDWGPPASGIHLGVLQGKIEFIHITQ